MLDKPTLSYFQIWNMCFGFLGIQCGFALQNANTSRIFQTLGASIDEIPLLWIAAPLTGLLVQPIIGYLSDNTWTRLGRRRPYFVIGAILTTFALFIMPNSPVLWIAALTLWVMDAAINITMEPFRAFVGDKLPLRQRALGFAMQSFFIGIGAVIASAFPWMLTNICGVSNTAVDGTLPDSVIYSFYFGGTVLFLSVMWTVLTSDEYSPSELRRYAVKKSEKHVERLSHTMLSRSRLEATLAGGVGVLLGAVIYYLKLEKELYILASLFCVYSCLLLLTDYLDKTEKRNNGVYRIVSDFRHMPTIMKQLAVVQFFSWFALFAMWIYTSAAVTKYHFGTTDTGSALYNEGANWVGILFAMYNGVAAVIALFIPILASRLGQQASHSLCLAIGALGLGSFLVIDDPSWLLMSMVGVGIAWASILSLPYAILSSSLPAEKMGVYMGIFNFFIVIPQLLAATLLGLMVKEFFAGESIFALGLGALSWVIAALSTLRVADGETRASLKTSKIAVSAS